MKKLKSKELPTLFKSERHLYSLDYETHHSSCTCSNTICRCKKIENVEIKSVNIRSISASIVDKLSVIDAYCVDRILTIRKVWDPNGWYISTTNGYYGEEVGNSSFDLDHIINEQIQQLFKLKKDADKIRFVLKLEYGYVLKCLKICSFSVQNIEKSELIFGRDDHYNRLDNDIISSYVSHTLPLGICVRSGVGYRIIDGYHRCASFVNGKRRKAKIFVKEGEEEIT